jgi:hypothetical protein
MSRIEKMTARDITAAGIKHYQFQARQVSNA